MKITINVNEEGKLSMEIEGADAPEQALWALSTASLIILTEEPADENVQELSDADGEKEESDVSDVQ